MPLSSAPSVASSRLPGATRSGLIRLSTQRLPLGKTKLPRVGPRELKDVITSSLRPAVPTRLDAPTVITDGSWPGDEMLPYTVLPSAFLPALPAATTTTSPAAVALRAARASGSVKNDSVDAAPRLRLTTRMLAWPARCSTQSMPASMSAMLPTPRSSSTRTSYRSAPGAMPLLSGFW